LAKKFRALKKKKEVLCQEMAEKENWKTLNKNKNHNHKNKNHKSTNTKGIAPLAQLKLERSPKIIEREKTTSGNA